MMKYSNNQVTFRFLTKTKINEAFKNDICTWLVTIAENVIGLWMVYEHINGGITRDELP